MTTDDKQKEFETEMKALLEKYNANITASHPFIELMNKPCDFRVHFKEEEAPAEETKEEEVKEEK